MSIRSGFGLRPAAGRVLIRPRQAAVARVVAGRKQDGAVTCVKQSTTTSVCTAMMKIVPGWMPGYSTDDANVMAGAWTVNATVNANDGDYWISDAYGGPDMAGVLVSQRPEAGRG
ncbi:hypothetical protein [Streptomyces sp. NPDC055681]